MFIKPKEHNKIIIDNQIGFRKEHGTQHAIIIIIIISLIEKSSMSEDRRDIEINMLVNLKKNTNISYSLSFYSLKKLIVYGTRGNLLKMMFYRKNKSLGNIDT